MTLSATWRGVLDEGDEQWLRLPFIAHAPAVVVVEVSRPLDERFGVGEPVVTVCANGLTKNDAGALERSPTRQVLLVNSAGDLTFRVASQDRLRPAGPVKVTWFTQGVVVTKDTEEIEIEPEIGQNSVVEDDHADTLTAATPLEIPGTAAGEIGNVWGDDSDVFSFDLAEERTVLLVTQGPTDTIGGLLDASGQLLAVDDDGGDGGNFRLVRALVPGRYFVRVEGSHGAEGPYSLIAQAVSW